jgi:hypothetical protein
MDVIGSILATEVFLLLDVAVIIWATILVSSCIYRRKVLLTTEKVHKLERENESTCVIDCGEMLPCSLT